MKLVFVGMNNLLVPFANAAAREGNSVTIFNGYPFSETDSNVNRVIKKYRFFGLTTFLESLFPEISLPFYFSNFSKELVKEAPDTVIVMDFIRLWFWQTIGVSRALPGTKFFLYAETKQFPQNFLSRIVFYIFLWYLKQNISKLTKIFVYTREGKEFLQECGIAAEIVIMPTGIDTSLFHELSSKIYLPDGIIRLAMNARFVAFKNHKHILLALAKLSLNEQTRFSLSFLGSEDDTYKYIQSLVKKLGLEKRIQFLPKIPFEKVPEYYWDHDVLILPSNNEAIGRVVPEAMACGLMTITSDTVGANIYVRTEETGIIFKTGDINALTAVLKKLVRGEIAIETFGRNAAQTISSNFSEEICNSRFLTEVS